MSSLHETFFTAVGCMDGRVQEPVAEFGRATFGASYPDTITEAGYVGFLATAPSTSQTESLLNKLQISIIKHHSKGIIVHGHEACAGNPVSEEIHKDHIRKSIHMVRMLTKDVVPVVGVYVKRQDETWICEKIEETITA